LALILLNKKINLSCISSGILDRNTQWELYYLFLCQNGANDVRLWYYSDYKRQISNTKRLIFVTESVSGSFDVSGFYMEFVLQGVKI
jgi:hypothetical protein